MTDHPSQAQKALFGALIWGCFIAWSGAAFLLIIQSFQWLRSGEWNDFSGYSLIGAWMAPEALWSWKGLLKLTDHALQAPLWMILVILGGLALFAVARMAET